MNPITLQTISPTLEVIPLALAFASRLLLTEKSSVMTDPLLSAIGAGPLTTQAAPGAAIRTNNQGYDHYGIND